MKRNFNKKNIKEAMEQTGLSSCISDIDPSVMIMEYEKGELIISPLKKNSFVFFMLDGDATVYVLDEKGAMTVTAREGAGSMIGDPELFFEDYNSVFVEARTRFRVLAFPYDYCRNLIKNNESFTYFMFRQIINRENRHNEMAAEGSNSKEKILFYIKNICPDRKLSSIAGAADTVRCSYRQAQRAVSDLCSEGILEKTGKGAYTLKQA